MKWYFMVWRKYAVFKGRARRKEFWIAYLVHSILMLLLLAGAGASSYISVLFYWYLLVTLIPSMSVIVRRLHDMDKSAWWLIIGLIPAVGALMLQGILTVKGDSKENRYGPDPKEQPASIS